MSKEQKLIEKQKEMKQKKQLEEWTGLKYGNILFDSNVDNWKTNTSVFDNRIKGKKQLLFIIEDNHCEKFGYYLNTRTKNELNKFISTDRGSFEFNIESNGRLKSMIKCEIKDISFGYQLFDNNNTILMKLGDIIIYKDNNKSSSYCNQTSNYNYHGISNTLCGKINILNNYNQQRDFFTPLRIIVIQMEMNEEQKRIQIEKEELQKKQLEEWTGLKYGNVLFDSDIDNWSMIYSVFDDKVKGKKRLVFLIEDDEYEKFGYYLNTQIINERNYFFDVPTDNKSFEFNVESNGRLKSMMKFSIKNTSSGYSLYDKEEDCLISIGNIVLMKENKKSLSYCHQRENNFYYKVIPNDVCGRSYSNFIFTIFGKCFVPLRIRVIQMK